VRVIYSMLLGQVQVEVWIGSGGVVNNCHYCLVCETSEVGHGAQQTQYRQTGSEGQARINSVRM